MILLSGGFDPLHPGHLRMIHDANKYGDVHIALNSDDWLIRKKGFFFQDWASRAYILRRTDYVVDVCPVEDSDGTVCKALRVLQPKYFGNGGDRTSENTPELDVCKELGIEPVFGLGGEKFASSSAINARNRVHRLWGHYVLLDEGPGYKVKRLVLDPKASTSRQRHWKRRETWIWPSGHVDTIPTGDLHQLTNPKDEPLTIIEVQTGICEEDDIERC